MNPRGVYVAWSSRTCLKLCKVPGIPRFKIGGTSQNTWEIRLEHWWVGGRLFQAIWRWSYIIQAKRLWCFNGVCCRLEIWSLNNFAILKLRLLGIGNSSPRVSSCVLVPYVLLWKKLLHDCPGGQKPSDVWEVVCSSGTICHDVWISEMGGNNPHP